MSRESTSDTKTWLLTTQCHLPRRGWASPGQGPGAALPTSRPPRLSSWLEMALSGRYPPPPPTPAFHKALSRSLSLASRRDTSGP